MVEYPLENRIFSENKGGILMRYSQKRANPRKIIVGFQKVFKQVSVKKQANGTSY